MNYQNAFADAVRRVKAEGRYRVFADLLRRKGEFPVARWRSPDGNVRDVTVWCSNDYLGMGQNPIVTDRMIEVMRQCGAGAGGTRNISGTNHYHVQLERELSDLHGKEAALIFSSGYVSNWAALGTLAGKIPGMIVYSDALNHASMIEGIRHARCEKRVFRHNDPQDLERLLQQDDPAAPKLAAAPGSRTLP